MNYDMIERFLIVMFAMFGAFLAFVVIAGSVALSIKIYNKLDPAYAKKVEQESLYIAKCKSMGGIHAITNDVKYCYKEGKLVEIE